MEDWIKEVVACPTHHDESVKPSAQFLDGGELHQALPHLWPEYFGPIPGILHMHESRVQGKCITNKAIPTRTTSFSKEKGAALGGTRTHDTLLSRQSALPTELPGQLSKQGSKSTIQHNTRQSQTPILCAMA